MKIKYLGHSAFLIQLNNVNILIDPFIKDNPLCSTSLNDLPKINYIFVTHGHSDHLGDTTTIAKSHGATVICNYEICLYLSKYNIKCHPMHIGGTVEFPFGKIKMTPALHGSSILEGTHVIYAGNPCGFLFNIDENTIYHAGDTGLSIEMKLLEYEDINIAMLPIGGNFTMDIKDCLKAIDFIKPKKVIPMHYDTFDLIRKDPIQLKEKSNSCEIEILKPGQELNI